MQPIPYGKQFITEEDILAVSNVLKSEFLTQGPQIEIFEKAFTEYIGAKYGVAVSNGTAALHIAVLALNLKPGQRVITSPITFAASANCVLYAGGEVHFADIDPESYCLDINKVAALIESKPKGYYSGIIPVDFAGYPVDLEKFRHLADQHNLWIIEDACHAPGGYFISSNGSRQKSGNGSFADLSIFSFHPVKHIATGEGGIITTNNPELYKKLKLLRTHGITKDPSDLIENHGGWYYEMHELGFNYRLTDFQAALGTSQLRRADEGLERRKKIATRYNEAFRHTNVEIPSGKGAEGHAWHLYVIKTEKRKDLYDHLRAAGIYAQVHYIPVHTMPYYKNLGWMKGDFPLAEAFYEKCLSLPMYPQLTEQQQDFVIDKVLEISR